MYDILKGWAWSFAGAVPTVWGAMILAEEVCAVLCRVNRFSGLDIAQAILAEEMTGGVAIVWIEPAARRIENRASHLS